PRLFGRRGGFAFEWPEGRYGPGLILGMMMASVPRETEGLPDARCEAARPAAGGRRSVRSGAAGRPAIRRAVGRTGRRARTDRTTGGGPALGAASDELRRCRGTGPP